MSRRESRSSLGVRQNDALFEFENFKKKFLLANKHITKLNSTLSVRIEELNAQISMLYVENLRLRASEIALAAQLKRERQKSWKVLADAEAACESLTKHLLYLRETHNMKNVLNSNSNSTTPLPQPPTRHSPRAKQRPGISVVNPETGSPVMNRISRPPDIPGIMEDEEPGESSEEDDVVEVEKQVIITPPRRKSKKPRLSASKLPLPTRGPSPVPGSTSHMGDAEQLGEAGVSMSSVGKKPRKTIRRQSGLLSVNTENLSVPRSASPAFGSPIRLEAGRAEEAEEYAASRGDLHVEQEQEGEGLYVKKERRKVKLEEHREYEYEYGTEGGKGSGKQKDAKGRLGEEVDCSESFKPKVKDMTIPLRTALQPIDSNIHEQIDNEQKHSNSNRQFLRAASPSPIGSAPTSRGSSSPTPESDANQNSGLGGRERRTRKSVNYAEPKLNTKMRKPDPIPGVEQQQQPRKKRSSAAAVMSQTSASTSYKPSSASSSSSHPSNADPGNDADNDTEARSSLEGPSSVIPPSLPIPPPYSSSSLPLRGSNGNYIDPDDFPEPLLPPRPGSAAAMYSPGPPARTTGSTTSASSSSSTNASGSSSSRSNAHSTSSSSNTMKKKKSKPQLVIMSDEENDSDGADAEYVGSGGGGSRGVGAWVNVEGRRKAVPKRSAAAAAVAALEDIRRHSMAL